MSFFAGGWLEKPTDCPFLKKNANKKQNAERNSFLLQVRFGAADAKVTLQEYIAGNPLLAKTPMKKQHVKEIFFKNLLHHLPRKSVESLVEFLFQIALRHEYICPVPKIWIDDEQEFIVSPTIGEMKPGPKRKE